jgi:outer membrane lipase/esterase
MPLDGDPARGAASATLREVRRGAHLPAPFNTPGGMAEQEPFREIASEMAAAFNTELRACFDGLDKVLLVDLDALIRDEVANPAAHGLSNVTSAACGFNPLGGLSVVCNGANTLPGDVSHYMFADFVHPTPYQYSLMARNVAEKMRAKGWL